jgi:tetratricopeptide (TPR) repeat protein
MLFDLKGKRRRAVQATYLTLALLMGGGLVFFGIGGDVSGGLFDAFSERGGAGGSSLIEDRLERAEKRLRANPRDAAALTEIIRANYQLAADEADRETGVFGEDARDELAKAGAAWERYLQLDPKRLDPSLAQLMVQAYGELGLNQPAKAVTAAEVFAEARPNAQAYLQLTRYASLAGQSRKADLAGEQAIALASKNDRSTVKQLVKQAKTPAPTGQTQQSGG